MNKDSTITLLSGNKIPVIGVGTWEMQNASEMIAEALKLGYPMIDTSSDYGTQPGIAEAIKKSGVRRQDFYLVTKVEETDDAYERVKSNLRELKLDYADLMLIHRPPRTGAGEALWADLIQAREEGLTRDIGVSNYTTELIDELIDASGETPVVNQIEWTPFGHSGEMLEYCQDRKIIIQAYSPLTRTEKLDNEKLGEIAEKHGKTPAQIMIRWNLQLGTIPIPKADSRDHLMQNIDVFDFELSEDDMNNLSGLNEEFSALGRLPYTHQSFFA